MIFHFKLNKLIIKFTLLFPKVTPLRFIILIKQIDLIIKQLV